MNIPFEQSNSLDIATGVDNINTCRYKYNLEKVLFRRKHLLHSFVHDENEVHTQLDAFWIIYAHTKLEGYTICCNLVINTYKRAV